MSKVFVLGSINLDLNFIVEKIPESGETIKSQDFFISSGGKGANQAVAIAKQNTEVIMLGSLGDDPLSDICLSSLNEFQVKTDYVTRLKNKTCGLAGIIIHEQDNRIITYSGANTFHEVSYLRETLNQESNNNDILISQLEIPIPVITAVFDHAKNIGLTTILNAAPAQELPDNLLALTDILVVNESEFKVIYESQNRISLHEALDLTLIFAKGVGSVVLTLGADGSRYYSKDVIIKQNAYEVNPVDTTAAGDTFIGAFSSQLVASSSIEESLNYASAAAALTTLKYGAQSAIPYKEEVIRFMREHSV
jgi:ribokinase